MAAQTTQSPITDDFQKQIDEKVLGLIIRNRDELIYKGKVESITSYNKVGRFDILPKHSNFISLLEKEISYKEVGGETKAMTIENGIIKVENNLVKIYLGIGG